MKRFYQRFAFGIACLVFAGLSLFAWRWPLSDARALSDFASLDQKTVRTGVDVISSTDEVRAIQDGTIIYADFNRPGSRRMPVPMQAMIAVEHEDGIVSVYDGLEPNSVRQWVDVSGDQAKVREGSVIAKLAPEKSLRLLISDTRLSAWINPFLTLPLLRDDRAPVISDIFISYPPQQETVTLRDRMSIAAKEFALQVSVRDVLGVRGEGAGMSTVPYSISIVWNGAVVYSHENVMLRKKDSAERSLEYYKVSPAELAGSRKNLAGDIALSLACVDGANRLEIRAVDLSGNRVSALYRLSYEAPPIAAGERSTQ